MVASAKEVSGLGCFSWVNSWAERSSTQRNTCENEKLGLAAMTALGLSTAPLAFGIAGAVGFGLTALIHSNLGRYKFYESRPVAKWAQVTLTKAVAGTAIVMYAMSYFPPAKVATAALVGAYVGIRLAKDHVRNMPVPTAEVVKGSGKDGAESPAAAVAETQENGGTSMYPNAKDIDLRPAGADPRKKIEDTD